MITFNQLTSQANPSQSSPNHRATKAKQRQTLIVQESERLRSITAPQWIIALGLLIFIGVLKLRFPDLPLIIGITIIGLVILTILLQWRLAQIQHPLVLIYPYLHNLLILLVITIGQHYFSNQVERIFGFFLYLAFIPFTLKAPIGESFLIGLLAPSFYAGLLAIENSGLAPTPYTKELALNAQLMVTIAGFIPFELALFYSAMIGQHLRDARLRIERLYDHLKSSTDFIVDQIDDPIIVFASDLSIYRLNTATRKRFPSLAIGMTRDEIARFTTTRLDQLPLDPRQSTVKHTQLVTNLPLLTVFQAAISPLLIDTQLSGYLVVLRDITAEKQLESAKEAFLLSSVHHLNTPLGKINVGLDTLLSVNLPEPKKTSLIKELQNHVQSMTQLIKAMMRQWSAKVGKITFRYNRVPLRDLLTNAVDRHRLDTQTKGLTLNLDVIPSVEVLTDQAKVDEILNVLIGNAIKYQSTGTIHVTAMLTQDNQAQISVIDRGIGIPAEHLDHLFTPFYRGEAMRLDTHGLGMGLAIAQTLAESLGTVITVTSQVGQGSTFSFKLPIASLLSQ